MNRCRIPRTPVSPLTREIRPGSPRHWALPRHRLSEVRTRPADAGRDAGCFILGVTPMRTGDVESVREVFVTPPNMERGSDTFNPDGQVFFPIDGKVSQPRETPDSSPEGEALS